MTEQVSKHDALMNAAYDRFDSSMSREEFLAQLGPVEYEAVIVGNLNYQVQNGGFMQWVDNQYYTPDTAASLARIFTRMGTPASKSALTILREAVGVIERFGPVDQMDEMDWDEFSDRLDDLGERYYAIDEQLMADFEAQL
jgi:hypothetical protein